ncbi:MAG: family 16 glycoside hydrolase [Candidatus Solibacter sp.]
MGKAVWLWLAAGMASAQTVSLTVNTGIAMHSVDPRIYGQAVDSRVWGEAVRNRSFEDSAADGVWKVSAGVLEGTAATDEGRLRFGDDAWRDYELAMDVARPSGSGVITVGLRSDERARYALSLGGPSGYQLARVARNASVVLQSAGGVLENGRWYNIRLRVEGQRVQVWLDGRMLFDLSAPGPANGQVMVSVRGGTGKFAHFAVKSLAGTPLWSGTPTAARGWSAGGNGEIATDSEGSAAGNRSLRIAAGAAETGVEQGGIAVRTGDALRGSLWLTGTGTGIAVRLVDGTRVLAEQAIAPPSAEWKEVPLLLTPRASSENALLRIVARARSTVKVDQVTLMPESARANGGLRNEAARALAALRPPVVRWFAGNWKDGIGAGGKRAEAFGVDEFLALAAKLGAEAIIALPAGPEALELTEYCNGAPATTWGKVRAQNGHAEPYHVKYWEWAGEDSKALEEALPALKADRAQVIGEGGASKLVDFVRVRQGANTAGSPRAEKLFAEWNAQDAVTLAGAWNALERDPNVAMAAPATPLIWGPAYAAMKLLREAYAPDVLQLSDAAGGLNATATRSPDGGRIFVKMVNPTGHEVTAEIVLRGDFPLLAAGMKLLAAGSAAAVDGPVERKGMSARVTLPPGSVAVVLLSR